LEFQYDRGGIHLPQLRLWLDPHGPKRGEERVFVSHAHSDHIARHRAVTLTEPTAHFMRERLGGRREEHILPFHSPARFGSDAWQITLLPAGHILGSAMSFIETDGESLLYTGDFKLRSSPAAEPCAPRRADVLIMETTFGRQNYVFPPTAEVFREIARFCGETLDQGATPVLLAYSLGKSQELLSGLAGLGLPISLHPQVAKITTIYEKLGQRFPAWEKLAATTGTGRVLISPPGIGLEKLTRQLGPLRTAVVTGWALDPRCRFRYRADAAFPISDHADFPELIEFVKQVAPRKVYTLHGFAADFARSLRELGVDAQALSEHEQLELRLG
jgi:Cft2 family RNA processing exonuclease